MIPDHRREIAYTAPAMATSARTPMWFAVAALVVAAAGAWVYGVIGASPDTTTFSTRILKAPPDGPGPVKIRGDRRANYFVKVRDVATGRDILVAMLAAGETIDLRLAVGSYDLRYAAGETWEGEKTLFGPDTIFMRNTQILTLAFDGDRFMGFITDLVPVPREGATLAPIAAKDF